MKPPKCKFNCGQDHWSPICPKYQTKKAPREAVKAAVKAGVIKPPVTKKGGKK